MAGKSKDPRLVTPSDFDFSKAPLYRKTATLRADQIAVAKGGESVVTRQPNKDKPGSFVETTNTAKAGDRIVTRSPGDSYVVPGEKWGKLYEPHPSQPGVFRSTNAGRAVVVKSDVQIKAPWGEMQTIKKGGVIFKSETTGDVYGNQRDTFRADFKREAASKAVSAKRQAAVEAYKAQFNREPPKRMAIYAMTRKVEHAKWQASSDRHKIREIGTMMGADKPVRAGLEGRLEQSSPAWKKVLDAGDQARKVPLDQQISSARVTAGLTPLPSSTGVTNDVAMGTTSGADRTAYESGQRRLEADRKAYTQGGGRDPRGRMFEALSGEQRVTSGPSRLARTGQWVKNNPGTALSVLGTGVAAVQGYSEAKRSGADTASALIEGAKSAAVPAAIVAAPTVARVAGGIGTGGKELMKAGFELSTTALGTMDNFIGLGIGGKTMIAGGALWGAGRLVQGVATVAGKGAVPALAAWQAYQGYKQDGARGALKGAITAFDPTELGRLVGFKQGVAGWAFDKAAEATAGKDMSGFNQANAAFNHSTMAHEGGPAEFERTYKTGPKAGITEVVVNTRRAM